MPILLKQVLMILGFGGILGLLVLGAAAAAGSGRKLAYWIGGTAWGVALTGMLLSDCMGHHLAPSALAHLAYPLFFAGVLGFPVALAWKQQGWLLKWFLAQVLLLLALGPGLLVAVVSALCTLQ